MHIRVAIEGSDGSGKTSISRLLSDKFKEHLSNYEMIVMREPGSTAIGELIRTKILFPPGDKKVDDETFRIGFMLSHSDLVARVQKFETAFKNTTVLLDRYSPVSNYVYERYRDKKDVSWMLGVYKKLQGKWRPDLVYVLIPEDEAAEALTIERSRLDRANTNFEDFDSISSIKARMDGYKAVCKTTMIHPNVRGVFYGADETIEDIASRIFNEVIDFYDV